MELANVELETKEQIIGAIDEMEVEDYSFLHSMVFRIVEDMEIVIYTLARAKEKNQIDKEIVEGAIDLIEPNFFNRDWETDDSKLSYPEAPIEAIVKFETVQKLAGAPLPHDDNSLKTLSKYINYHLINLFYEATTLAKEEELPEIKLRHYLPACEKWPWPLNHYC